MAASAGAEIPVRNAWQMLLYAWDLAEFGRSWRGSAESGPSLFGVLALVLAEATRTLLRQQLGRTHLAHRETVRGVKGRIDFARSLKQRTFERGAAHCTFAEVGVDSPKNRILRATLLRLGRDPRVRHEKAAEEERLRTELRRLVGLMEGVTLGPVSTSDFGRLQLGRNDRAYALPMAICALVWRLEVPTEESGHGVMATLMREEMAFERLFERFVRNFYRMHLPGHVVKAEGLSWHDEAGCRFVPAMRTDTTIVARGAAGQRLVIDTKFSKRTLAVSRHGAEKFKSENLYQLYAYLRTQEHLSAGHREAEGMLLYPTTGVDYLEEMRVQGHRIRVATVDLSLGWEKVEERLLGLVGAG